MKNNLSFTLWLIVIMLISWANVFFFGTSQVHHFSQTVNQAAHFVIFFITGFVGYLHWGRQGHAQWLKPLWMALYAGAFILFLLLTGFYFMAHISAFKVWAANIRNAFTSPLVFLVFYIIHILAGRLSNGTFKP